MDNYSSLLFELSSTDRLDILLLLEKAPLRLSHLSSKLNFTVQETSRNVTRLSDAKLIRKDADGAFHLTSYGEENLNLISGFAFLFKNKDYFLKHTLSSFPEYFRIGIGMLDKFEPNSDVMMTFHNIENMIASAEKFVWILSNQVLASTIPLLLQELERGGEFKLLMPRDYLPSGGIRSLATNQGFHKARRSNKFESRFLDKVDLFLCLSEKEVAALGFPNLEGKIDYTRFRASGDLNVGWAKILYRYYWDKATSHVPDQLVIG